MYRSLLVPLDGSAFGEHALPFALSIARRAGATLNIVRVHSPYDPICFDKKSLVSGVLDAEAKSHMQLYLDRIVKRLATVSSASVASTILDGPYVAEAIIGHAAATGIDLIVMTTHGLGPLSRFWLGSVADELVQRAAVPIILVRPHEAAVDFTCEPVVRNVLIPLDGSDLAEQVLEPALALGELMQADYELLRVCEPLRETGLDPSGNAAAGETERFIEPLRAEAQDYLNRVAERLKAQGMNVHTHIAVGQHAASVILDTAQELAVNLIALETHGRGGLSRLAVGSVADKVLRGASIPPIPVLVHRSSGK